MYIIFFDMTICHLKVAVADSITNEHILHSFFSVPSKEETMPERMVS